MRPAYRNYDALKEAHQETTERADEPPPVRPGPMPVLKPDAAFLARHAVLEQKVAYADALQEQVDSGLLGRDEKAARLSRFDRGDPNVMREAQQAQQLREARMLAGAARTQEFAEQTQIRAREGPER